MLPKKKKRRRAHKKKKPTHLTEEEEKPAQWIEKDVRTESSGGAQIKKTSAIDRESSYPENRGRAKKGKPDQWIKEDFQTRSSVHANKIESVKDIFKEEMKTSVINKSKIKAKDSTQEFLETHLLKSVTLIYKLRQMRTELIFSFE